MSANKLMYTRPHTEARTCSLITRSLKETYTHNKASGDKNYRHSKIKCKFRTEFFFYQHILIAFFIRKILYVFSQKLIFIQFFLLFVLRDNKIDPLKIK